jgi:hypothetical protein
MQSVFITAMTTTTALGRGLCATRLALETMRPGLSPNDFEGSALEGYIGRVAGLEDEPVITSLAEFDCRNHRLAQLSLRQDNFEAAVARARARYGPSRIAVLIGTTTAGMHSAEVAYRECKDPEGPLPSWSSYCHTQNLSRPRILFNNTYTWAARPWPYPPPVHRAPRSLPALAGISTRAFVMWRSSAELIAYASPPSMVLPRWSWYHASRAGRAMQPAMGSPSAKAQGLRSSNARGTAISRSWAMAKAATAITCPVCTRKA